MQKINLIIMGGFLYPKGMAATKRIQHIIDVFSRKNNININLLLLRQSHAGRDSSNLSGRHRGVPFMTIGHDVAADIRLPLALVKYLANGFRFLGNIREKMSKNILYVYGGANIENILFVIYARILGYKVTFDIVEDYYYVSESSHLLTRLKYWTSQLIMKRIKNLADGVIVISSFLRDKFEGRLNGDVPLHVLPISIDFNNHPGTKSGSGNPVCILYAGSFGDKDAVENLIEAFESVCRIRGNVELVLTGQGVKARMEQICSRIRTSPYADQIRYLGFLDDDEYYRVINSCDIPCMVRDASDYANAGFPFKLGEYLATGNPVIASKTGDVAEFLVDHQNAVLVEPGSVTAITRALLFILDNPVEASKIGLAGRRIAEQNFEMGRLGSELLEFLDEV